jgi:hypothetical protein
MSGKKSLAKTLRNMTRLIKFLQTKIGKPPRRSLTVCPQPVASFRPKSPPAFSTHVLAPTSFSPKPPSKPSFSTQSSQTFDVREPLNTGNPQIDGFTEEPVIHLKNHQPRLSQGSKCDNCHTVFETKRQLELHDEMNQFGCEDFYICFTSKFHADLHELKKHPDTSYVVNHIPYTTKLQFAAGFR